MNYVKYCGFLVFFLISNFCIVADDTSFLDASIPGSSARMIALGNIEGMSKSADAIFENPASLFQVSTFSSSFFTSKLMQEVVYLNGAVALRLPLELGVVAAGVMDIGVRDIPRTTYTLSSAGDNIYGIDYYFDYSNSLYKLAYQISANSMFHYGLSASYYQVQFDTVSGSAVNMDFGVYIDTQSLDFSFVMKNFLSSKEVVYSDTDCDIPYQTFDCTSDINFDNWNNSDGMTESLSLETIYSLKYTIRHLSVMAQIKSIGDERSIVKSFGAEFNPSFMSYFSLYGGMMEFPLVQSIDGETEINSLTSLTLGIGIDLLGINFDYAYGQSEHEEYQHKHYFSAGFKF